MVVLGDLETPRLSLRAAGLGDLAWLRELWDSREVRRFLFDDAPVSMEIARDVLQSCVARHAQGLGLWLVFERSAGRPVGCAGLLPVTVGANYEPRLAGLVEPLIAIDPDCQGRRYGSESLEALLGYAFEALGMTAVAAIHDVPNVASGNMVRRAGFVELSEVPGPRYRMQTYLLAAADRRQRGCALEPA